MGATIDQRVVEMRFDNKQFESNVATTMKTLDKLDEKLDFKGAGKGLDELQRAVDKVSMRNLTDSADAVEVKFSAMSIAAIAAINNIVTAAMNAGEKIVKSLTIDQITAGFDKYTQKTEAVQTIMNATGLSVEEVTEKLAKLQWFTDETSYSFTDMVNNIAKFTSQGVELDTAVSAMEGIALAAADAGVSTTKAGSAMEALSKAMGKGYVELIRWGQLGTIQMDTVKFKNVIMETAAELGTLVKTTEGYRTAVKGTEVDVGSFGNTLHEQWLTNDVLLKSLKQYSSYADALYDVSDAFDTASQAMEHFGDMGMETGFRAFKAGQVAKTFTDAIQATSDAVSSGWMETFEIIFGNFDQSVALWTEFTEALWDIFASGAEARNNMLRGGLQYTAWERFMKEGAFDAKQYTAAIKAAARAHEIAIDDMIKEAGSFEATLSDGWLSADILSEALDDIVNSTVGLSEAELANMGLTEKSAKAFADLKKEVDAGNISLEEYANLMTQASGRENILQAIRNAWNGILTVVEPVKEAFQEMFPALTAQRLHAMTVSIREFTENLKLSDEAAFTLKVAVKALLFPIQTLVKALKLLAVVAFGGIRVLGRFAVTLLELPSKVGGVGNALRKVFGDDRYTRLVASFTKIVANLSELFGIIRRGIVSAFSTGAKTAVSTAINLFTKLTNVLAPIAGTILDAIVAGFEYLSTLNYSKFMEWGTIAIQYVIGRFQALISLFKPLREGVINFFKTFDFKAPLAGLQALLEKAKEFAVNLGLGDLIDLIFEKGGTFTEIINGMVEAVGRLLQRLTPAKILIFAFGTALTIMIFNVSKVTEQFGAAIKNLSGMFSNVNSLISAFTARFKPNTIKQVAEAIVMVAAAVGALALLDSDKVIKSTIAIGALMVVLTGMTWAITRIAKSVGVAEIMTPALAKMSVLLVAISGSIVLLAGALFVLGKVDISGMLAKFVALISLMGAVALFAGIMQNMRGELTKAAGFLLLFALSMGAVVSALEKLAKANLTGIQGKLGTLIVMMGTLALLSTTAGNVGIRKSAGLAILILDLLVMVSVLKKLAAVDVASLSSSIVAFIGLVGLIAALSLALSVAGQNAAKAGWGLLLMSGALVVLGQVIKQIGSLTTKEAVQGGITVGIILAEFAGITAIFSLFNDKAKNIKDAGNSILAMSAAILVLGVMIKFIGSLDGDQIVKGLATVSALMLLFDLTMFVGSKSEKSLGAVASMAAAIGVMTAAIMLLDLIPTEELIGLVASFSTALISLGLTIMMLKEMNPTDAVTSAVMLGVMLLELVVAFRMIQNINANVLINAGVGIGLIIAALGASMKMMNRFKWTNYIKNLALMGACLAEVVAALSLMNYLSGLTGGADNLIKVAGALSGVLVAMGGMMWILGSVKYDPKSVTTGAIAFAACLGAVTLIMGALGALVSSNIEQAQGIIDGAILVSNALLRISPMLIVMTGFAAALGLLGKIDIASIATGAMAFGVTAAMIALLITGIDYLNNISGGSAVKAVENAGAVISAIASLTPKLILLGIFAAALGLLGAVGELATIGAVVFDAVFILIGTLLAGMGALIDQYPDFERIIEKGAQLFVSIATTFGEALGGFVSGALTQITSALPQMGQDFGDFAEKFTPFLDLMKDMGTDTSVIAGIGALVELLLALTAKQIVDNLNFFGTGGTLSALGRDLEGFSEYFATFLEALPDVPPERVLAAAELLTALGTMLDAIPSEGGIFSWFTGSTDFKKFGEGMVDFGDGMGQFVEKISKYPIDSAIIETTKALSEMVIDLSKSTPKVRGLVNAFVGENMDMGDLGSQLSTFGNAMWQYSIYAKKIDTEAVIGTKAAAQTLLELAKADPKEGGLWGMISGEYMDMHKLGSKLVLFARGMAAYSDVVAKANIDNATIDSSVAAGKALMELSKGLPKEGGAIDWWFGESMDMADFGEKLKAFGVALSDYSNSLKTVNTAKISASATAAQALVDVSQSLETAWDTFWSGGRTGLDEFGGTLKDFGDKLYEYYAVIDKIEFDTLDRAVESINGIVTMSSEIAQLDSYGLAIFQASLATLANAGIDAFVQAFADATDRMTEAGREAVTAVGAAVSDKDSKDIMQSSTEILVGKFADGVEASTAIVHQSALDMVAAFIEKVGEEYEKFVTVGKEMIAYVCRGIQDRAGDVEANMRQVIQRGLNAVSQELGITNQESSEFYKMGIYTITGYTNGVLKEEESAFTKVKNFGKKVIDTVAEVLGVSSPSKEFSEIGRYCVEGLVKGLDDNQPTAAKGVVRMGKQLLQSMKDFFEIQSPSRVTRDEVGVYLVQGIADGIAADTSAEDAAARKAQNIINAFKTEIDKFDLDTTTSDLEFQLWEALNPDADDDARTAKQIELLTDKLTNQANIVNLAQAQYQATLQALGADAEETQQAYNTYLQEQITMAKYAQEMADMQKTETVDQGLALVAYAQLVADNMETLKEMGFLEEEIRDWAAKQAGWLGGATSPMSTTVSEIVDDFMSRASGTAMTGIDFIASEIEEAVAASTEDALMSGLTSALGSSKASAAYTGLGTSAADDVLAGFNEGIDNGLGLGNFANQLKNLFTGGDEADNAISSVFEGTAIGAINNFIDGLKSGVSSLFDGGVEAFTNWLKGWLDASETHSPSRVMIEQGGYLVAGLSIGIDNNIGQSYASCERLIDVCVSGIQDNSDEFAIAGYSCVEEFTDGLRSNTYGVEAAAYGLTEAAVAASKTPVDQFTQIGEIAGENITIGLQDEVKALQAEVAMMCAAAIAAAEEAFDDDDNQFIIRPVIDDSWEDDLADIYAMAGKYKGQPYSLIGAGRKYASRLSPLTSMRQAQELAIAAKDILEAKTIGEDGDKPTTINNYNYTQNNTSPKALNQAEIYRQTRNQFSQLKEATRTK